MKEENYLLVELKNGNKVAFTLIFHQYYRDLVIFAGNYLQNKERCEDIVQSVFLKLWSDREILVIEISLKSFLLKSVKMLVWMKFVINKLSETMKTIR